MIAMEISSENTLFPRFRVTLGWSALFLLLFVNLYSYPAYPAPDLDASWRIALGYFFNQGAQFGRDVIFTYGPLGFTMGNTYAGSNFTTLVIAQAIYALIGATVVLREVRRLQGVSRWSFFGLMMLFSLTYVDAAHMIIIALMGFQLLRAEGQRCETVVLASLLALFASVKFTDLMLAALMVGVVSAHSAWHRRWRETLWTAGVFAGAFLAIWLVCGQSPLNLPGFFRGSWSISQGYTEAMGFPSPWPPLWKAFVVLGIIGSYLLLHLWLHPDKPRALANGLMLAGFIFLNWKHGFVRADGHMIGFFFCAFVPLTAYPGLLDDPPKLRRLHYAMFSVGIILCLWGIENALYGVTRSSAGIVQERIWRNIEIPIEHEDTKARYVTRLLQARTATELAQTKKLVQRASIDMLGYEQAAVMLNELNYRPRPVIQSYSVFNSYLAKLNGDFYSSDSAPDYLLLKIQSIDYRMPMMDDPVVWRIVPHRYDFVLAERGYQLWRKLPKQFNESDIAPKPLKSTSLAIGEKLSLAEYAHKQLWVRIDLKQTLFGRLHTFLYKPPHVTLIVTDENGHDSEFFMPLPQGKAGFILSPIIEDAVAFVAYANGQPGRETRRLKLRIKPGDLFLFANQATVEISELKPAGTGAAYFTQQTDQRFHMFKNSPVAFESQVPDSEATIAGHEAIVMHAPSLMTFNIPKDAHQVSGFFGYLPGAYSNGGKTDGAEFIVYWADGAKRVDLLKQYLDPGHNENDRGPHEFKVSLNGLEGGRLYLRIGAGPTGNYSWDWTWWSGIEIR